MIRLHLVRPAKAAPKPSEQRSAKVIDLRARREARRLRAVRRPDPPAAA